MMREIRGKLCIESAVMSCGGHSDTADGSSI